MTHTDLSTAVKSITPRELEVLQLLWKGHSTRDIARQLHRSFNTIAMHRRHILSKLGVNTTAAALRIAWERGLIAGSHDDVS